MKSVLKKLFQIQQGLKVQKNNRNSFGGYNFRNAEQILEALKPLLNETNCVLFSTDSINNIGDSNYITTTVKLVDIDSGEHIEVSSCAREDKVAKGMAASQMTGCSSSYSKKYALQNLFAIDNSKDADNEEISISIFKGKIDQCTSKNELMIIWNSMNETQKNTLKSYMTQKKNSLK